ncbi:alpha-amylase family glycosyl hydrolase, partial [Winogradskyella sp.]|uniref:alpha-amylase family glycosyl hydrolase n=1 Tax=Winogradskyella sp. TaxID=1883156 RepID=UPI0025EBB75C
MKNYALIISILFVFVACKSEKKEDVKIDEETAEVLKPISASDMETAVIYEANIRQYSPEGTFEEFTKDIPQLRELGVKVIWLMPVFPISETKRKATGGPESKFASEFPVEERAKYLGSYYAVTDFTKINPEFGTKEDFRKLVKTAHANGIYVILDWVPNHTGWDHEWLKTNPEYYTQNEAGEVIHPEGTDWTDVADLNYDNADMRKEMIADMTYWITEEGVDGFRCDVAGSVPLDFWQQAIPDLRNKKDIFMLAEAWEPELLDGNLFDMAYAWDGHHLMNALAKGEKNLKDYEAYIEKISKDYDDDDILMNFVTNHDENSWNGTIKERMGKASELMTALSFMQKGMPLIYSGQEYDLDHRLKFFEKDSIPKTKG